MHILVFAGTRPEAIKTAPIIHFLRAQDELQTTVCTTGQHKEMLTQAFADFHIIPDENLAVMTGKQSLSSLSSVLFQKIDPLLERLAPDWILVQGDTTTVMVAALCAFYRRIRIGHVEAGLRSFNRLSPFPEELNRKVAGFVADLHFAPTLCAKENLLREGIAEQQIVVTGNTVVDALHYILKELQQNPIPISQPISAALQEKRKIVLVTAHRRENHGSGLNNICQALYQLAHRRSDVLFIYPVHLNPRVWGPVHEKLSGTPHILLTPPLPYKAMINLMQHASFILTDSGGLQEEATVLHKPVLVLRNNTERPEGVRAGAARLVGTEPCNLIRNICELLDNSESYRQMAHAGNALYGDGNAAKTIVTTLLQQI